VANPSPQLDAADQPIAFGERYYVVTVIQADGNPM